MTGRSDDPASIPGASGAPPSLPSTVPERKRADATVVVAPLTPDSADAIPSGTSVLPDSYQPQLGVDRAA